MPSSTSTASPPDRLRERVASVGTVLVQAVTAAFAASVPAVRTGAELTRATGLNRNSASKLMMAIERRDPLAALYAMPGPEALGKLVSGARRLRLSREFAAPLETAIASFRELVRVEFEGKPGLDGAIALWLPDVRERVEAANRQMAFRGIASLRGVSVDTMIGTNFAVPSATVPGKLDSMLVGGYFGMRRTLPHAPLRLAGVHDDVAPQGCETIDGRPMHRRPFDGLLHEYSTKPMPHMAETRIGEKLTWEVADPSWGLKQALDFVVCDVAIGTGKLVLDPGQRVGFGQCIDTPARNLVLDTFLHKDVWCSGRTYACAYDTAANGMARPNDRSRDMDRYDIMLQVQELGRGFTSIAESGLPDYRAMIHDVCTRRGWQPDDFRGYRMSTSYPIYSGHYVMLFEAPV